MSVFSGCGCKSQISMGGETVKSEGCAESRGGETDCSVESLINPASDLKRRDTFFHTNVEARCKLDAIGGVQLETAES